MDEETNEQPRGSNALALAIGLLFLVAVNAGLAMLFYNAEQGFQWFVTFFALTTGVLLLFAVLLNLAAKRVLRKKVNSVLSNPNSQSESTEQS